MAVTKKADKVKPRKLPPSEFNKKDEAVHLLSDTAINEDAATEPPDEDDSDTEKVSFDKYVCYEIQCKAST
jgi:hypothetical protein